MVPLLEDMGVAKTLDAHIRSHGHWQGASVGTLVTVWLCHILQERDHRLVSVRQWVAERAQTWASLLGEPLRDTDCTDDRLANVLSMLGAPQMAAGNEADDGLYVPAYEAAVCVLGRRDLLFVGDSKMAALATRAHLADKQSAYLCSYRAPHLAPQDLARWVEEALTHQPQWQT